MYSKLWGCLCMGPSNHKIFPYTVGINTYALLPHEEGHRTMTRVIEDRSEFVIETSVYKTISSSCSFYRGTLESASLYARNAVQVKHKPPIIIGEYYGNPLIFFPTHSPKNKDSIWFNFDAIDLVCSDETGKGSIVHLSNGETVALDVSPIALRNQHSFAGSLRRYFKNSQEVQKHQMVYFSKQPLPVKLKHFPK